MFNSHCVLRVKFFSCNETCIVNLLRRTRYTINNPLYYSTIAPFYHIRAKKRAKYAPLLHGRTGQKYGLKAERQNGRTKLYFISGIINPLFDGLTYNTSGYFAHCTYFSSQLAKYPRVLYVKPSNKVYETYSTTVIMPKISLAHTL